jgi:hypothetical protein
MIEDIPIKPTPILSSVTTYAVVAVKRVNYSTGENSVATRK